MNIDEIISRIETEEGYSQFISAEGNRTEDERAVAKFYRGHVILRGTIIPNGANSPFHRVCGGDEYAVKAQNMVIESCYTLHLNGINKTLDDYVAPGRRKDPMSGYLSVEEAVTVLKIWEKWKLERE